MLNKYKTFMKISFLLMNSYIFVDIPAIDTTVLTSGRRTGIPSFVSMYPQIVIQTTLHFKYTCTFSH